MTSPSSPQDKDNSAPAVAAPRPSTAGSPDALRSSLTQAIKDARAYEDQDRSGGRGVLCQCAFLTRGQIKLLADAAEQTQAPDTRPKGTPPLSNPWRSMESAPKGQLIDIWIKNSDGSGVRWADCYYDSICGQWRTSRPGGKLVWVYESAVTHWRYPPAPPGSEDVK